jgi:hypothetical protein
MLRERLGEFAPLKRDLQQEKYNSNLPSEVPPDNTAGEEGDTIAARSACQGRSKRMLI